LFLLVMTNATVHVFQICWNFNGCFCTCSSWRKHSTRSLVSWRGMCVHVSILLYSLQTNIWQFHPIILQAASRNSYWSKRSSTRAC